MSDDRFRTVLPENPLPMEVMTQGLTPGHDFFFPRCPDDPEMRESTSIWMFEENGAFGFPRIGIEAEAHAWDDRMYRANFALGEGRIMLGAGRGVAPPVTGPDGQPSVLGAGPLTFRCIEPFRRWRVTYEGMANPGTLARQLSGVMPDEPEVPVRLEAELAMHTPAWVQDFSPEKVAAMSPEEQDNARNMGVGWRLEHLFRGVGSLSVDGQAREFRCVGSRIKRQSVRPLDVFRGHCWQSALFPDGRAFGYIAYPPREGADLYFIGYVYQDGRMYPARPRRIPFITEVVAEGDDVSLELETELGVHRIGGATILSTFRVNNPDMAALGAPGFTLQQSGARYHWDGLTGIGMIERSATGEQMAQGYHR